MAEILFQKKPPERIERIVFNLRGNFRDILVGKTNEQIKEGVKPPEQSEFVGV
jgi:hypothetical protein